jgi:hypothetical protein
LCQKTQLAADVLDELAILLRLGDHRDKRPPALSRSVTLSQASM